MSRKPRIRIISTETLKRKHSIDEPSKRVRIDVIKRQSYGGSIKRSRLHTLEPSTPPVSEPLDTSEQIDIAAAHRLLPDDGDPEFYTESLVQVDIGETREPHAPRSKSRKGQGKGVGVRRGLHSLLL